MPAVRRHLDIDQNSAMPVGVIPAKLDFRDETPYSAAYGDVYHSAGGGPAQARHVFLAGNGLPARWQDREALVILETGFGAGLNFLATWRAWRDDPRRCRRLHFVSVEKHPFAARDLALVHQRYPELRSEAAELHAAWPPLVSGAHRLDFGAVVLTLFFADVAVLRDLALAADAIYLDGFAPANNPEMWTHQVMRSVSRLAAPGATVATWSVAAAVRDALQETGFAVEKHAGFAGKREMLAGRNMRGKSVTLTHLERKAAVVGAGVAGAAVCERLCSRGWEVELYERHAEPAQEASGNHAGTFHPIATPDDSLFARLTRAGFLYAISRWKALEELRWDPCGVLQLARTGKEARSQEQAVAGLPEEYARFVTAGDASRHAGVPLPAPGVWFPAAGWVQPQTLVRAQLEACGGRLKRKFSTALSRLPDAPVVVLANSSEAPRLAPVPHLRLRRVRGQLTYLPQGSLDAPRVVVVRGGMVLPPVDGVCVVGASYDIEDEDRALREDSHAGNLERLKQILDIDVKSAAAGRVAFRAVTPDRLPVAGRIAERAYGAFAYGSRGLVWAALAAEIIASDLEGEPLPLENALLKAIDPGRFRRRAESRARPA
jgi:tRNA 5-methylaminomethyl-2-thiouridine biosynthesis bifunctional protein